MSNHVSLCRDMTFLLAFPLQLINWDTQMNLVWGPGNDKQGYAVCISVSGNNGEITSTKSNVEIIFSKYHYH